MRLALALLIGILALAQALQWRGWPPEPPAAPAPGTIELPQSPAAPSTMLDEGRTRDEYLSVAERPLFLPDRRPPPDEPAEPPSAGDDAADQLVGLDINAILIGGPDPASVWLVDPRRRNELIRRRLGEEYKGWVITAIDADRVRFERQGVSETLELQDFATSPAQRPSQAPRRAVRRPPARALPKIPPASQRSGADHDR